MEHTKITPARPLALEGPATFLPDSTDAAPDETNIPDNTLPDTLDPDDIDIATRHDGWTRAKQAIFLRALSATHCVAKAARAAGMSRQSAYALRARLKGEPFDRAWQAALLNRFDALAEAALDRALNGVEVQHYYKGELVGTSRKYDERLTVALLAMRGTFQTPRDTSSRHSSLYAPDDFGPLVERVESGPETWREEMWLEYEDAGADDDEYEDDCDEDHDGGDDDGGGDDDSGDDCTGFDEGFGAQDMK